MTSATDPEGRVTGFEVDALGRRIRMIAPDPTTLGGSGGPVTEYAYDSSGRLTSVKAPDADGAAGNFSAAITSYEYDNLGRLASVPRQKDSRSASRRLLAIDHLRKRDGPSLPGAAQRN